MVAVTHLCPVCGYDGLYDPPRSPTTGGGSYEICPSCGFEFGVTDDDLGISYVDWRRLWIREGMQWQSVGRPQPHHWDPATQLHRLDAGPQPLLSRPEGGAVPPL